MKARPLAIAVAVLGGLVSIGGTLLPWSEGEESFSTFGIPRHRVPNEAECERTRDLAEILGSPDPLEYELCVERAERAERDFQEDVEEARAAFDGTYHIGGLKAFTEAKVVLVSSLVIVQAALLALLLGGPTSKVALWIVLLAGVLSLNLSIYFGATDQQPDFNRLQDDWGIAIAGLGGAMSALGVTFALRRG